MKILDLVAARIHFGLIAIDSQLTDDISLIYSEDLRFLEQFG